MSNTNDHEDLETRPTAAERPVFAPAVDVLESADEYRLVADLPGVRHEDIDLAFERGELVVSAKRSLAREGEALALARREGDFRRAFRIPEEVDASQAKASFEHGVLEIRLPKAERVKPRRIAVQAVA
jgi:HSP20 family protein